MRQRPGSYYICWQTTNPVTLPLILEQVVCFLLQDKPALATLTHLKDKSHGRAALRQIASDFLWAVAVLMEVRASVVVTRGMPLQAQGGERPLGSGTRF